MHRDHPRKGGCRECRVRSAPAVSCATMCEETHTRRTGTDGAIRHSLRNGLTAYAVLSPATNSSCHRRLRIEALRDPVGLGWPPQTWHQQRASGPHGFAVRSNPSSPKGFEGPSAVRPFAPVMTHGFESALPPRWRDDAAASTTSRPAFVTTRDPPLLLERDGMNKAVIWVESETEYS